MAENEGKEEQGGEENQNGAFFDGLSEENQANPTMALFKTADSDTVAKTVIAQQAMAGKKGIMLPKEGDADDLARFNTEIGGISDSTKFELSAIENEESIQYSQDAYKELCAKMGVTQAQAAIGQDLIVENSKSAIAQQQKQIDEAFGIADQKVRAEMGPEYDLNMSKVDKLIMGNSGDEAVGKRLFDAVKKDPEAFQALSRIAEQLSETSLGKISPISAGKSPDEAEARIAEIMKDPAYGGDNDKANELLMAEVEDLGKILAKAGR